ncbi:hypothetical protein [Piscinibacter sakaiensis]|uniref:Uncharacterized protein n=1 Tax=Piscinibacter sakaiensis TaxID=1547922 RepID=A0A0K8NZB1_PISS1|nr:hypothetical protein [Piscinibacter sakaiensis]GAP35716.1 hypothetical protein ISF6_1489 [Piscinibacter sakaiensis]
MALALLGLVLLLAQWAGLQHRVHHGTPAHLVALAAPAGAAGATGHPTGATVAAAGPGAAASGVEGHAATHGGEAAHAASSAAGHGEPGSHDPGTCRLYDALACVDLASFVVPGVVPAPAEPPRVGIDPVAPCAVQAAGFLARGPPLRS